MMYSITRALSLTFSELTGRDARISRPDVNWANEVILLLPGDLHDYLSWSHSLINLSSGKAIVYAISCPSFNIII